MADLARAATLVLPCPCVVLAEADLEKYEKHRATKPERPERDGEHKTGYPAYEDGAECTGDGEHRSQSVGQDACAGSHLTEEGFRTVWLRRRGAAGPCHS